MVLHPDRRSWRRDLLLALGCYAVPLAFQRLSFRSLQLPIYLLVLGFDAVQNSRLPGLGGGASRLASGAYLPDLAALATTVAGRLRHRSAPAGPVRHGVVGALMSFVAYGRPVGPASVGGLFSRELPAPLLAAVAGLAGLGLGRWLADRGHRVEGE